MEMAQGWAQGSEPVQDSAKEPDLARGLALALGSAQEPDWAQAMEVVECLYPAKFQGHEDQTKGLPLALDM